MTPDTLDITALQAAYRDGRTDPIEVTQACLARIERRNPDLRAFITVSAERARAEARASRDRWRDGEPVGALDGIPIALKDNIDVAGLPCTAGAEAFRDRIPVRDAPIQSRLAQAGAVLLGKLNMHEGALGATTDNLAYGRCMNPLHAGHTPGGSSGGSGAAVAAGLCGVAIGSDTMGSIRIPAAYCGVFGYKPSNAVIPGAGIVPLSPWLDVAGPLAARAVDAATVARVLMGATEARAQAYGRASGSGKDPGNIWRGLRIGVPLPLRTVALHPSVQSGFDAFLESLRRQGAHVTPIPLEHWDPSLDRRAGLLISEADALAWWQHEIGDTLPGLSPPFSALLRYALRAGQDKITAARARLAALRARAGEAFSHVDLIALPTTPSPSFPHSDTAPLDQADLTALANFYACPAWAVPIESGEQVVSAQLMGPPDSDLRMLALAPALDGLGTGSERFAHARRF